MAYLNHLLSVPCAEVEALRKNPDASLTPSVSVSVSHLIAYWVQVQPLGQLLGQAIDGGSVINSTLKHQLRDPCYQDPEAVKTLLPQLTKAWEQALSIGPVPDGDWYRIEIEKVLRVFTHAADHGECVVSVLEPCHGLYIKRNK
jgi:hypothetical protein